MAIIKFGPTVVGARGTIAGTIFSANKAGPYARDWSRGANPRTELQSDQRGRFSSLASAWRDLTQAERDDWIDYADDPPQELTNSLGETYFASGFNWYVRINDHLEQVGAARRDDAPTLTRPLAPIIGFSRLIFSAEPANSLINFTVGDPDLAALHLCAGLVVNSEGRTTASLRSTTFVIAVPNVGRNVAFKSELEAVFGTIVAGQRAFYVAQIQDAHGQRGPVDTETRDATAS